VGSEFEVTLGGPGLGGGKKLKWRVSKTTESQIIGGGPNRVIRKWGGGEDEDGGAKEKEKMDKRGGGYGGPGIDSPRRLTIKRRIEGVKNNSGRPKEKYRMRKELGGKGKRASPIRMTRQTDRRTGRILGLGRRRGTHKMPRNRAIPLER